MKTVLAIIVLIALALLYFYSVAQQRKIMEGRWLCDEGNDQ